ncbi:TetR/AcrR family transcriptional regulator [Aureibacter tunicatorum]|uniref:AcrR family transcriptional regulator n=1 Tax=Aureibacter tunicatorum TaxID=866807 RepID=A0AAE3XJE1_9BACT|nr:TetR/AcrR family transcriptional regulator [Aureibacter tunicatorum]MDR6238836.1 AcrR family transcriptional regulator [Aureibacter tunicatorum]BDD05237.1 TetR family transcriptional regulator [Aureibacter tunicatorum]
MAKEKAKKKSVKERTIEAASRLFYEDGYNQTGINQIIEEASVAKASLYQHFRSKEDIAVAYLERRHENWMNALEEFTSKAEHSHEKITMCFDYLDNWLTSENFRGCGFQNIIADLPKDQLKIKEQVLSHKNSLRTWLRKSLSKESSLSINKTNDLADQVLVLMEGAIILSQIQNAAWPIHQAKSACEKLLS